MGTLATCLKKVARSNEVPTVPDDLVSGIIDMTTRNRRKLAAQVKAGTLTKAQADRQAEQEAVKSFLGVKNEDLKTVRGAIEQAQAPPPSEEEAIPQPAEAAAEAPAITEQEDAEISDQETTGAAPEPEVAVEPETEGEVQEGTEGREDQDQAEQVVPPEQETVEEPGVPRPGEGPVRNDFDDRIEFVSDGTEASNAQVRRAAEDRDIEVIEEDGRVKMVLDPVLDAPFVAGIESDLSSPPSVPPEANDANDSTVMFGTIMPGIFKVPTTPQEAKQLEKDKKAMLVGTRGLSSGARIGTRIQTLPDGGLPEFMRRLSIRGKGREAGFRKSVENTAAKLNAKMKQVIKRVGKDKKIEVAESLDGILKGRADKTRNGKPNPEYDPKLEAFRNTLKVDELEAVLEARNFIDNLSAAVVASGMLNEELTHSFKENIGSYLTRSYRAFDQNSGWNMDTMPESTKQGMLDLLNEVHKEAGETVTPGQLEAEARSLLGEGGLKIFMGSPGKRINVGSLKNRNNDLDARYRAFLGEIKNPVTNVAISGANLSQLLVRHKMQQEMVDAGLKLGLFSETEGDFNEELNFAIDTPVFPDHRDRGTLGFRQKDGTTRQIYAPKVVVEQMNAFFDRNISEEIDPDNLFWRKGVANTAATATGLSKIAQVIMNPGIYATAWFGGVAMEVANGRVFAKAAMRQGLRVMRKMNSRRRKGKVDAIDPIKFEEKTAKTRASKWDGKLTDQELELMGTRLGLINQNVLLQELAFAGDSAAALSPRLIQWVNRALDNGSLEIDAKFKEMLAKGGSQAVKAFQWLGQKYAIGDNAGKLSGLMNEARVLAKAHPDWTLDEVFDEAGEKIRQSTPTFDRVPRALRNFSLYGLGVGQYVSFAAEIFRNTWGSIKLAKRELASGNPVLQRHGALRLASTTGVGLAVSTVGSQAILGLFSDQMPDDDDEKNLRKFSLPPWLETDTVSIYQFDPKTGEFSYAQNSYTFPQAAVVSAVEAMFRDDDDGVLFQAVDAIVDRFGGGNLVVNAAIEAKNGTDQFGTRIWHPGDSTPEKIRLSLEHVAEKGYTPGAMKLANDLEKAYKDHQDTWGRQFSLQESIMNVVLPVRTKTYNIYEMVKPISRRFSAEYRNASEIVNSEKRRQKRSQEVDQAAMDKAIAKRDKLQAKIKEDFREYIKWMVDLRARTGQSISFIANEMKNDAGSFSNIPTDLRDEIRDILPSVRVKRR